MKRTILVAAAAFISLAGVSAPAFAAPSETPATMAAKNTPAKKKSVRHIHAKHGKHVNATHKVKAVY